MRASGSLFKTIVVVSFFVVVSWVTGFAYFINQLPKQLDESVLNDVNGIVVLTGGAGRVPAGIELIQQKFLKPILVTGVNSKVTQETLLSPYNLSGQQLGFVELDYSALTTRQNIAEAKRWAGKKGLNKILLVTSYYHMPRSLMLAHQIADDIQVMPYPVFSKTEGLSFVVREYHKYLLAQAQLI